MGREIDERVVQMKFENGQFEKGISTSIRSMEELKKGMNFDEAVKGFDKLDRSARSVKMDGLAAGVEAVRVKFDLLQITAFNVLNRISNKAIDTGERMVKSLSIEQISVGWDKFAEKTGSVQTIMAATSKQFTDTGEQMSYVNKQLDKLNWFTDETSYNFVDMVNNIGKFTSNNIALDESVTAMQGIANWAAISGANAGEASRAMYNLSQSMASGSMKLMDWMSIENANMGTAAFKEMAIQMALTAGTLKKSGDKIISVNKGMEVSVEKFRDTLSTGWLDKKVLMATLNEYGQATNKLNKWITELSKAEEDQADLLTSDLVGAIDDYQSGIKTAEEISKEWGISLEKTQEVLNDFSSDTDKFGLKAFKAAQEAKTFEDAINSVKDAVSTGWMKSFEYIFGDYLEAKEFFTDLANTLYDIFAAGSVARNKMLKEWKDQGGRDMFIDTIWGGLAAILSILKPIQLAWTDIFGEMTAERLLNITKSINGFVISLAKMGKANIPKLTRTFRGLFAVLDMLRMLLGGGFRIVLSVLQEIFGAFNVDVFEFTGSIGDALVAMRDWMREGKRFDNVIDDIIAGLKYVITEVRSFINAIKEFGPVKAVLNSFHSIFTEDFRGIESILAVVGAAISAFWNVLTHVPKMTSLDDVRLAFIYLGDSVSIKLEEMGISFEGIKKVGETVFGSLIDLLGSVSGSFETASNSAKTAIGTLGDKLKQVDWAGVALLATGISILALAWKIADSMAVIAKSFGKATDVMKSVKGMTDAIGNYFKALKDNIQSNNILKIAVAIAILAASFTALAALDAKALLTGAAAIAIISGALIALLVVTDKYGKGKAAGGGGGASFKFASVIVGFAAAVYLISKALNTIEPEGIVPKLVIMAGILGAVLLVTNKMNRGSAVERAIPSIGVYLGFAIAVGTLVNALKKISDLGTEDLFMALPVLAGLMVVMAVCARLATRTVIVNKSLSSAGFKAGLGFNRASSGTKAVGGFGTIIAMALAVNLLIMAIKSIAKVDPETMVKGLIGLGAILAEISVVMIASKLAGQNAKQAGKMILYITIALNLLVPAIKGLGSIPQDVFEKGLLAVAGISAVLSAVMVLSKFAGENAAKAGLLFIALAGSLMALQLVIKTLGRVDTAQLVKGTASVSAVILALGVMLKGAGGNFGVETTKSLVKLTIIIGILGALMLAMSFIEPAKALASSAGISAVLLALGASLKLMDKIELPKMKDVAKLYSIVAVLGTVLGLIAYFTDPKSVLAAATGLSEVLLAVAASGLIMQNAKMPTVKQATGWAIIVGAIGGVIAVLAGIAAIAKANGTDVNGLLVLTTGISEVLIALSVAGRIMDKQKNPSVYNTRAMNQWVISVGALIAALAIVQASINMNGGSVDGILKLTSGMSEIILALALASRIMGQNGGDFKVNAGAIVGISALVAVIGLVLAAFSNFTDPNKVVPLATALSAVMLALAGTMRIISGIQSDIAVNVGMLAILSIITGLMGAVLAGLSNITNPDTVLPIALGLSAVMAALGVVVKLLSATPPAYLSGAWSSLAMMGVIVAAMAALTLALGELMQLPGFKQVLADGGEGMKLLGQAIGNFVGGIVGGVVEGALSFIPTVGTYLTQFMENAQGFFDGVKNMPSGIGEMVGSIVVALLALTGAELLNSLANFANYIFGSSDSTLADKFKTFGEALKAFSDALGDNFNADKVESAANAGKALAQLEASLPRQGGKLQDWLGSKNLGTFGLRIVSFGAAIRGFGEIVKDLPVEAVEAAANAGQILSDLENSLPAQGGKLQDWIGSKNLGDFGKRIKNFGTDLFGFAETVKGITKDSVQGAYDAGDLLRQLEENLPATDGLLQQFLGQPDLGSFGTRLTKFGGGIKAFSDAITANGGLDNNAIENATLAIQDLVDMESQIDTAGGWGELFTGKSDFSSFGKHLEDLGGALKSYNTAISAIVLDKINAVNASLTNIIGIAKTPTDQIDALKTIADAITYYAPSIGKWSSEASTADTLKMEAVTKEIEKLLKLSEISDATTWIVNVTSNISLMIRRMLETVNSKYPSIKEAGRSIAYWLIKGITDGINDYQFLASNAATKLGEKVDQSVRDALQVASPSVKMIEVGHWVVKGLAEGITKDMSAEEAAKKKADNIVAAFQGVFDRIDLIAKNRSLQYELWTVNEGRNATDAEKQQRQLEDKALQLQDAADKVAAQRAAFETAKKSFAEGSDQYIEAENRVLEALKSMYELRNEIDELQKTNLSNGVGSDAFKAYRKFIDQYQPSLDMLGWSEAELIQKAKEASGYGMEKKGLIDTESIIASAFSDQKVDIAIEPIKQKARSSGTSIAQAGVDAAVEELGGDSTVEKVVDTVSGVVEKATKGEGKELLDSVISTTSDYVKPALENTSKQIGSGFANSLGNSFAAVKEKYAGEVTGMMKAGDKAAGINSPSKWTYQSGLYIGQGLVNGLNEVMPSCAQAGTSVGTNTVDGLTRGIEERGKIAIAAAQQVASKVASIMSSTLQINSPSKLTRSFGNYVDEGLALGLRDGLGNVEDASREVANSTLSAIDYAKDLINDIIEADDDFSPTITPVLNLDEINRQAPGIRRALNRGGIDLSSMRRQAGFIDQYVSERQNGTTQMPAQTNYNFTQNNYSPKALNRAEIYRQTNNQFSRLKGASQR